MMAAQPVSVCKPEEMAMKRLATCSCGKLTALAAGDPITISVCHCSACRKRTGSAFGVAVFFDKEKVECAGVSETYSRLGRSGKSITFHFCPSCGSTVYWLPEFRDQLIAVALGCFQEPETLTPVQSAFSENALPWITLDIGSQPG